MVKSGSNRGPFDPDLTGPRSTSVHAIVKTSVQYVGLYRPNTIADPIGTPCMVALFVDTTYIHAPLLFLTRTIRRNSKNKTLR